MLASLVAATLQTQLRPPSVPIITHDPYFSIWSPADRAYDKDTTHWTGRPQALTAAVIVDGKRFRLLGLGSDETMPQQSLIVTATQTTYTFSNTEVQVKLRFTSPLLPHDLDLFSRPVTYVTFESVSLDKKPHDIGLIFSLSGTVAANVGDQKVLTKTDSSGRVSYSRVGTEEQPVLQKRGDDLRIDWGYAYLASDRTEGWKHAIGPKSASAAESTLTATKDFKGVTEASAWLMVAYDDIVGLRYFDADLVPYWRRKNGTDALSILNRATQERKEILAQCDKFDGDLYCDLERIGGTKYAQISTLAYRQAVAGNKLVADQSGRPLLFPKENFSNGCIGTVDVIYPMAPLWFLLGPDLAKAMLVPVLDYGSSKRWKFPFAPHDLGTYPHATGQVYGGGEVTEENQMPVEESGNMILLVAALAEVEGNAYFAKKYWPSLTKWAEFLKAKGLDPENQLCTDDFMGHLAHNANLSVKAILALGAFGKLAKAIGDDRTATEYLSLAKEYANQWINLAKDGDHTKLAFDKPGTWSQKYNMVWDDILGLNLFPAEIKSNEVAHYKRSLNRYGLPLDSRSTGMKVDWLCWTATLTKSRADFETLIAPMWDYLNETQDRVPICDWVRTDSTKHIGMIARPVLGGAFLPVLHDRSLWKSWFDRGVKSSEPWAPLPLFERVTVVPDARTAPADWKYTTTKPNGNWAKAGFADQSWTTGKSGFGTEGTPGSIIGTKWSGEDIWLRRDVVIRQADPKSLHLSVHHDEDVEIYINGVLALKRPGYTNGYVEERISADALKAIRFGQANLIAVHCHQTTGGQYVDVGFVTVSKPVK